MKLPFSSRPILTVSVSSELCVGALVADRNAGPGRDGHLFPKAVGPPTRKGTRHHYGPLPLAADSRMRSRRAQNSTGDSKWPFRRGLSHSKRWRRRGVSRRSIPTCKTFGCARRSGKRSGERSSPPRVVVSWWPTSHRSSCGSSRTSRRTSCC